MTITLKRAYDEPDSRDGYRVLVDRFWPRGLSKEEADLDEWRRNVAPSDALRQAFHAGDMAWGEFRRKYLAELKQHRESLRPLAERGEGETVTLVFGARDQEHNNAVVLKQYLEMLG